METVTCEICCAQVKPLDMPYHYAWHERYARLTIAIAELMPSE